MREVNEKPNRDRPAIYEIRVKGHLDSEWSDWFEGLTIAHQADGNTLLTGPVIDQAALHGLLKRVRDLGLPLISVSQVEASLGGKTVSSYDKEKHNDH